MGTSYHTNVKYNSVALLLGYIQVLFHTEVLHFLPIYFPHSLSISGKPYFLSWERLDGPIFVCTSQGQKSRVEVSPCSCHLKESVYVYGFRIFFSETCCTAAYSHLYK